MVMNAAEELTTAIGRALPDASITIDTPSHEGGHWFIDIKRGNQSATVEWRPKQGFGVGLGRGEYGEGPDIVVPSVEDAARHVLEYLLGRGSIVEPTVLVASGDFTWRSAVEERLREHHVWADAVATFAEASNQLLSQTYLVVVLDFTAELNKAYWDFRDQITPLDVLVVTVASSDHVASLDDSFEFIMNRRIDTDHVASLIQGLVAAAATGRSSGSSSQSA
jgi:hypothetical protein